jgi:hypothetical protein
MQKTMMVAQLGAVVGRRDIYGDGSPPALPVNWMTMLSARMHFNTKGGFGRLLPLWVTQ